MQRAGDIQITFQLVLTRLQGADKVEIGTFPRVVWPPASPKGGDDGFGCCGAAKRTRIHIFILFAQNTAIIIFASSLGG